jgi:hypothetical protein
MVHDLLTDLLDEREDLELVELLLHPERRVRAVERGWWCRWEAVDRSLRSTGAYVRGVRWECREGEAGKTGDGSKGNEVSS